MNDTDDNQNEKLKYNNTDDFENEDDALEVDADFEDIIEENEIDVDLLPERLQKKIADWGQLYDSLQKEVEENGKTEQTNETVLKLNTLNEGIVSDLQPILKEIQEEQARLAEIKNNSQNNEAQNSEQQSIAQNENPSWRFWM